MIKSVSGISLSPKFNNINTTKQTRMNQSTPSLNQDTVSFSGSGKGKMIGSAIGMGIYLGYWIFSSMILPPAIDNHLDNQYLRNFEYEAAETMIPGSSVEDDKAKLIDETIKHLQEHPEKPISQGCLDILDEYGIISGGNKDEISEAINNALTNEKLDKNDEKFYIEYLDSLNNN